MPAVMLIELALAAILGTAPLAVNGFGPAGDCAFSTVPVTTDLGEGVRSWLYTEPYHAGFFQDGLWHADAAYHAYVHPSHPHCTAALRAAG